MINYKNSEIKSYHKLIEEYKEYFKNNNINIDKNNINNPHLNYNGNNNLDYEKMMMELNNKDKIIKSLNIKLNEFSKEYKNIIDINMLSTKNNKELEQNFQNLINDKNNLIKENTNLKHAIANFSKQMKEANNIFKNKSLQKNIERNNFINKLNEYRQKVIALKKKINELHTYIGKLKNRKYQTSTNNSNFNNYGNILPIPSSPSLNQKISFMNNNQPNNFYTKSPLIGSKNGNIIMNNANRVFGNNIGINISDNKNGLSNEELENKQKKSIENYRKFLSQLEQNMPNPKP
jgi:hypothetical protein